jgi:hypothetical protein
VSFMVYFYSFFFVSNLFLWIYIGYEWVPLFLCVDMGMSGYELVGIAPMMLLRIPTDGVTHVGLKGVGKQEIHHDHEDRPYIQISLVKL